jgi:hypothetical protein
MITITNTITNTITITIAIAIPIISIIPRPNAHTCGHYHLEVGTTLLLKISFQDQPSPSLNCLLFLRNPMGQLSTP